ETFERTGSRYLAFPQKRFKLKPNADSEPVSVSESGRLMSLTSVRHLLLFGLSLIALPGIGIAESDDGDPAAESPVLQAEGRTASVPESFESPQAVDLNALLDLKRIVSRLA